jgi:hypothetical protein
MSIQAVFINRDGTIGGSDNIYPEEFDLFPNVAESLNEAVKWLMESF